VLYEMFQGYDSADSVMLRSVLSALTSLIISMVLGPIVIKFLKRVHMGQVVRDDGPQSHIKKTGTPTMGGLLILLSITVSTLLWANLDNAYTWVVLLTTVGFGIIGFVDDYLKVVRKNPKGLASRWKYLWQSVLAIIIAIVLYILLSFAGQTHLFIPFSHWAIPLGAGLIVLAYFVIVGSSNAVNLTDGLDGLVTMPVVLVASALGVFALITGEHRMATHFAFSYMPGVAELTVFAGSIVGAGLGFLWFNAHPAEVFMGDVGSLALGAALGTMAVIIRQDILLFIMGFVFVLEAVSVMLQVGYFKATHGKRIFKMAPIHHHFELSGWKETKVVTRFWLITVVLVLFGLSSLFV
jgi:phospho-N-acetylmuramoyl-pentapeptide-transferase